MNLCSPFQHTFKISQQKSINHSPQYERDGGAAAIATIDKNSNRTFHLLHYIVYLIAKQREPQHPIASRSIRPVLATGSQQKHIGTLFSCQPDHILYQFIGYPVTILNAKSQFGSFFVHEGKTISGILLCIQGVQIRTHCKMGSNDLGSFHLLSEQ